MLKATRVELTIVFAETERKAIINFNLGKLENKAENHLLIAYFGRQEFLGNQSHLDFWLIDIAH